MSIVNMWNSTLEEADASPRLDWMALRIQGKHFASKFELINDPSPKLQMTSARAKSKDREQD